MNGRDLRVAFVGDSFVAGVGDPHGLGWVGRLVAHAFAAGVPLTAYNLGVRGETSLDVRGRWDAELGARLPPGVDARVVLSIGANDATCEHETARVASAHSVDNLGALLADAERRGWPVLVVGPPPANDVAQQRRISELSAQFSAVAKRHGVPYVNVVAKLQAQPLWARQAEATDGAHPGAGGYELLADIVLATWLAWILAPARTDETDSAIG